MHLRNAPALIVLGAALFVASACSSQEQLSSTSPRAEGGLHLTSPNDRGLTAPGAEREICLELKAEGLLTGNELPTGVSTRTLLLSQQLPGSPLKRQIAALNEALLASDTVSANETARILEGLCASITQPV